MAGRGKTSSLTQEQLQTLGVGKDMPVQTAPPPTYPPLISKPVAIHQPTTAQTYQILWKQNFLSNMQDSRYYLAPKSRSQREKKIAQEASKLPPGYNWSLMPTELQPTSIKRRAGRDNTTPKAHGKRANVTSIEDRLKFLEEKERTDKDGQAKENSDSEKEDEEEVGEVAADEEMDDENDYGNSYFDNGEAYNEEDDILDDGPVY